MLNKFFSLACKKEIIISLIFSTLISGCYSYYGVTRPDYLKKESHNKTKFILKDNEEIIITNADSLTINFDDYCITFIKDSAHKNNFFLRYKRNQRRKV